MMKQKKLFQIVLFLLSAVLLLTVLPQRAFAAEDHGELPYVQVTDEAEEIIEMDREDYEDFLERAEEMAEEYGFGVYLIYIVDYAGEYNEDTIADLSDSIIDYFDAGEKYGGIILLIDCELREYDIYSWGKKGSDFFPDGCISDIEEAFLPKLKNNDWVGAGDTYLKQCARRLKNYDPENDPYEGTNWDSKSGSGSGSKNYGARLIGVGVVSLLAALIACSIMKGKMKSAVLKTEADAFIPENGIDITIRQDVFTHTTETRRKIETNSGSRGGGGGGGGSSHHSGSF